MFRQRALTYLIAASQAFPWASLVAQTVRKKSACNAGSPSSIPGSGRSPGAGDGNPLQYSCLENPKDKGAWRATVHGSHKELDTTQFPMFSKGGFRTWKSIFPAEKLQQIHIRWGWGAGSAGVWCWERTAFISHTLGKKDWLLDVEAVPPEASVTGPRSRSYQESDWEWHSNLSDTQAQGNNHCDLLSPCQGAFPNNLPSDWGIGYNTFSPDDLGKWKRKLPISYASPLWSHTLYISVTDHWLKKEWGVRGRDLYDSKAVFLKTFISWISEEISMENQGIGSWDQEFTI